MIVMSEMFFLKIVYVIVEIGSEFIYFVCKFVFVVYNILVLV